MPVDFLSEYAAAESPPKTRATVDFTAEYAEPESDLRGGLELAYPTDLGADLPTERPLPEVTKGASFGDILRRLPAGTASSGAESAAGILKGARDIISIIPSSDPTGPMFRPEDPEGKLKVATEFMRDVSERSRADYGVDPQRDQAFLSQVASSAGSVVPAIASGPFAPLTIAGMMGETGRAEAERFGATPDQQDKAFYANAAVGAVSEALLGVPALLRSVRAAGIPERSFRAMAKSAAFEALKGGLREGTQEAVEQTATNVIAKYIAEYDPSRPELQGAWQSFLVGAVTGAPTGVVFQTAQNLSEERAAEVPGPTVAFNVETATVTTPDGKVYAVDESGATEVVPGSPKDISTTVLVPKEKGEPSAVQIEETNEEVFRPEGEGEGQGVGLPEVGTRNVVAETPPVEAQPEAPVKLSPFGPRVPEGPSVVSTAIQMPDGTVITGETWSSGHPTLIPKALENGLPFEEVQDNLGFIVQEADGTQHFADRSEAAQVASRAGQVPEMAEGALLTSELLRESDTTQTEPVRPEPVEAPPGPPVPPKPPSAPPEDRGRPPLPEQTGIRNARVDANRIAQGLPPRMEPLRKHFGTEWDRAMQVVEQNPDAGSALIQDLVKSPRAPTPTETALLAHEQVTRENAYNEALRAVNEAPDEATRRTADTLLSRARDRNQEAYDAGQRAGTESAQSLVFRKMLINRDYSVASMVSELRALKGGNTLSPKESAVIEAEAQKLHERIKSAEDRAQQAEEQLAKLQGYDEWLKLSKVARKEGQTARREGRSVLDRMISNGEAAMERIRKRARSGRSMMSMTVIDPVDFVDYVQVGAGYIAKGIKTLGDFTARLVGDFGKELEPHGERIFNAAARFHEDSVKRVPGVQTVEQAAARDQADRLDPQVVYDVARAHVNAGVQGFEPTMQATTATLKAKHPDVTVREVRDAFSGYGKVTRPSQAADRVKLREYRRLAQLASAIEDAQKKIAPMRSGPQRDKATEAVRAKMAELKRAMQENGIEVTNPKQQLANAERAAITRLQNTVDSLERQIAAKTRDAETRGTRPDTTEIRALRERVESLRETLDEVAPKPTETDAQKVQRSISSTESRIAELDAQLRTGMVGRSRTTVGPTSPKLDRLRAERDAMVKLVRELRETEAGKAPPDKRRLDIALKAVDRQIAELDRQLKAGDVQLKAREPKLTSPELERKRAERDAMARLRTDLRSLSKPKLTEEQRAIRAVRKSIEELDRQIKAGELEPKRAPRGTPGQELESLRSERDSMRRLLAELRDVGKTKRTPEEVALSRYKTSLARRTQDIRDRIARNDYVKKPRKETELDREALDARFEYQKAKDAFEQKAFEYDLSRRGLAQKTYDTALEVLNTSRSIITSFDVSAPLRQGAFITLAHPIRSLRSFPAMFKAFGSEKAAFAIQESLSDPVKRPNAARYRQSGLDLTETGPNVTRRKLEEAYQSRFASKIPIVAGSQRAYTSFLNLLRADSFDAMVESLGRKGKVTDQEAKAIATFINIATGRGKYGQKLEQATQALNAVFFAPKYVASRFQLLVNPLTGFSITGGSARNRAQVAAEYGRFLRGAGIVLGLAVLGGAEVEDDPRSTDFGKIKIGNTRLDILGGLSQTGVLMARTVTGETKNARGQIRPLAGADGRPKRFGQQDRFDLWTRFARQKFSPIVSATVDAATGFDVLGQPITPAMAYSRLLVPLQFGDIVDAMVEQGVPKGTAMSIVSLFGASMSTYETGRRNREAQEPWEVLSEDWERIRGRNP